MHVLKLLHAQISSVGKDICSNFGRMLKHRDYKLKHDRQDLWTERRYQEVT